MLLSLMRDLNDLRRLKRARQSVNHVVVPLVEGTRKRVGDIPEIVWNEPYIIGYIATIITAVALEATKGKLKGDMLGHVQVSCWHDITGILNADIGDEILYLSRGPDDGFMAGIEAAAKVLTAESDTSLIVQQLPLIPAREPESSTGDATGLSLPLTAQQSLSDLELAWSEAFDEPVARLREAVNKLGPPASAP